MTALDYIREQGTAISCDTMDASVAQNFHGTKYINGTSNQIISYNALQESANKNLMSEAAKDVLAAGHTRDDPDTVKKTVCRAMAKLGKPIADAVDGCVLSQTAPSKAFDTEGTVSHARELIKAFGEEGIAQNRVIIKVPSTWEGLQACKILQAEGINTLGTMVFNLCQAIVAAQCNCKAISPYVNNMELNMNHDLWYQRYDKSASMLENPGVSVAKQIHEYYRSHNVKTVHIPAGMIDPREPIALSGIDEFTLQPPMLAKLASLDQFEARSELEPVKTSINGKGSNVMVESEFRWALNLDRKATLDLNEALNTFYKFELKLEEDAKAAIGSQ